MNPQTILHELMTSEWLMNRSHLLALYDHFQRNTFSHQTAEKVEKESISSASFEFYDENLNRVHVYDANDVPNNATAVVKMVGPMMKYWSWYYQGSDEIIHKLDFANNHQKIKSIVVMIDGPGGAVSAIAPFIDFASRKQKPVVAVCDIALSLHYWIPNAIADHIMAENTISSRFGSIGVVSSWMDATEYYEKLGIKIHEVYSDRSEHKNEVFRKIEEDEAKGKKMLKDMSLNPMAKQYQDYIKSFRPDIVEATGVMTGRVFNAEEALAFNMIDSIGNMQDAMKIAQILAETKQFKGII